MIKKKLLITWTARTFKEIILPFIGPLSNQFNTVVMLFNFSMPTGTLEILSSLKKEKAIEDFIITPDYRQFLNIHFFMKEQIKTLRKYNFDFWLTMGEMQIIERYIFDYILSEHAISICMWHNITYLFMYNEDMVKKLLFGAEIVEYPLIIKKLKPESKFVILKKGLRKLFHDINNMSIIYNFLRKEIIIIRKKYNTYINRIVLPFLMVGKTFRLGPYDEITQLGSGRCDAIIFFDEMEAKAHKALFKSPEIFVAQYPSSGMCRCKSGKKGKRRILSPLSNFVGSKRITDRELLLYYRDFQTVITQADADNIDLRLHPDETGQWPYQLHDYLLKKGINVRLVKPDLSIREIVCDYLGVAGSASSALRDCRASCDYVFVIGFVGISKMQFNNPKFAFASSEGIDWIEEDGSYNPTIFYRKKYEPTKRLTVPEIVHKLSWTQSQGLT